MKQTVTDFGSSFAHALSTLNSRLCGATSTCLYSRAPTNNGTYGGLQPNCSGAKKENRSENQRRHRIKNAGFPQLRYLNEIDTDALPADARKALPTLETLDFIKNGRNLILYGNPGTGKTHLATALGIAACNAGHSVLFTSVPRLLTQIRECRNALTLRSLENKFERYDMVICDEFGYVSCDKAGAEMLFNHLSLRTDKKTTVVTTNLAFNRWNEIIDDKVLVTAMVDRLTHKAILLNMTGKSYRMKETQEMMTQQI